MPSTSQEVYDQAAHWAALHDLGTLSPLQQAEFEQWLESDKRHLGAYARAEGTLIRVERSHGWIRGVVSTLEPIRAPNQVRRRILLTGAVAASLATIGFVGTQFLRESAGQTFSTGKGEVREVLLADGSIIKLNTDSKVEVEYTADTRTIHLVAGEAIFDVAKNKARPFVVEANGTRVRAVGTSFTVSLLPQRPVEVLVKEGVVELVRTNGGGSAPIRVSANQRALVPAEAPITAVALPQEELAKYIAWEHGRIAFDDEALQDAANEFARYSDIGIVVDPAVARMTITGSFVSNDPVAFARAAAATLGLQVEVNGSDVKIFRKSASTR